MIHSYLRNSDNLVCDYILLEILGKKKTSLKNLSAQTSDTTVPNLRSHFLCRAHKKKLIKREGSGQFFFDRHKVTFLSATIPHQARPSNPKSEKVLKTPPSAVDPLLWGPRGPKAPRWDAERPELGLGICNTYSIARHRCLEQRRQEAPQAGRH